MSRYFVIGAALALAVGCHGQSGNPFMRTTVPPPGTGAAATEPYYGGTATQPPVVTTPGAVPASAIAPAVVVPPPDKRFSQPGGLNLPQGSVMPRKAVDPNPDSFNAGTSAIARAARRRTEISNPNQPAIANATSTQGEEFQASAKPIQRSVAASFADPGDAQPAAARAEAPATLAQATSRAVYRENVGVPDWQDGGTSADADAPAGTTSMRIVDPNAESVASSASASAPSRSSALTVAPALATSNSETRSDSASNATPRRYFDSTRPGTGSTNKATQVSYVAPSTSNRSATGSTSSPEGAAAFSHHADYQWLRGKLEYSTASRRWKLRYIPIDGQTDSFGGSVVLPASSQLDQLHPGDFVTVRGSVGAGKPDGGGFSPLYQLQTIERQ